MSFRQYGGINYAARNNIVKNNYSNANNLSVMTKIGQPSSYINFESDISANIIYSDLTVDNLTVKYNTTHKGNLDVSGNSTLKGNLDVSGNSILKGNLDVSGNSTFRNLTVSNSSKKEGVMYITDDNQTATLRFCSTNGNNYIQSGTSSTSGTSANLRFSNMNNNAEWMVITSDGKVGIGTSNPTKKLEVSGSDALINGLTVGQGATTSLYNTVLGSGALTYSNSGYNTAIGYNTLAANASGSQYNTAIGYCSLQSNTNLKNTAVGYCSLQSNTGGNNNTAMGYNSMINNTASYFNTAFGTNALYKQQISGTTDSNGIWNNNGDNTAIGVSALYWTNGIQISTTNSWSGSWNTAVGLNALRYNTTGSNNTAVGLQAGYYSTSTSTPDVSGNGGPNSANKCTFLGAESKCAINLNPTQSTAIGYSASITASNQIMMGTNSETVYIPGKLNVVFDALVNGLTIGQGKTFGIYNTAVGITALQNNTGQNNIAIGYQSLYNNTSGGYNTAIGTNAMYSYNETTPDIGNTAVGNYAMFSNINGKYCTAVGYKASYYHTGASNTSFGFKALFGTSNTSTGSANCAIGDSALTCNTTGSNNTGLGYHTLQTNTSGYYNTAVGYNSGTSNTVGSCNTFIGIGTNCSSNNLSYSTAIGYNASVTASNQIMMGTSSATVKIPGGLQLASYWMKYESTQTNFSTGALPPFITIDGALSVSIILPYPNDAKGSIVTIRRRTSSGANCTIQVDGTAYFGVYNSVGYQNSVVMTTSTMSCTLISDAGGTNVSDSLARWYVIAWVSTSS